METAIQVLTELLIANHAHLRVLTQLEIERIARETGESIPEVAERIQQLSNRTLGQVKDEIYRKHPQSRS